MSTATSVYKLTISKKVLSHFLWGLVVVNLLLLNVQCRCKQGLRGEHSTAFFKKKRISFADLPPEIGKDTGGPNITVSREKLVDQSKEAIANADLPPEAHIDTIDASVDQQKKIPDAHTDTIYAFVDQQEEKPSMGDVLSITNQETDTTGNHKQDEIFTTNLPPKVDKNGSVSRIGHSTENRPQEFSVCGGGLLVHPMTLWKKIFNFGRHRTIL